MIPLERIHPGWLLLLALAVTAAIALNRGVDLLWGMAALLACAMLAGMLLPVLMLRGIQVRRQLPAEGSVGEPLVLGYTLEAAGWLPRYGLELLEGLGPGQAPRLVGYLPRLRGCTTTRWTWTPTQRGVLRLQDLYLECRYPLGLLTARRRLPLSTDELLIYPGRSSLGALTLPPARDPDHAMITAQHRGGHEEFFGLREYRPGDPLRSVHWRSAARPGPLRVRELEQTLDRRLWLVLDAAAWAQHGHGEQSSLERMCRIANSLAGQLHGRGIPVGLLWHVAGHSHRLEPGGDPGSEQRLREALARLQPGDSPPLAAWLSDEAASALRGASCLVFNLGGETARGELLRLGARHDLRLQLVELDPARARAGDDPSLARQVQRQPPVWQLPADAPLETLFRP